MGYPRWSAEGAITPWMSCLIFSNDSLSNNISDEALRIQAAGVKQQALRPALTNPCERCYATELPAPVDAAVRIHYAQHRPCSGHRPSQHETVWQRWIQNKEHPTCFKIRSPAPSREERSCATSKLSGVLVMLFMVTSVVVGPPLMDPRHSASSARRLQPMSSRIAQPQAPLKHLLQRCDSVFARSVCGVWTPTNGKLRNGQTAQRSFAPCRRHRAAPGHTSTQLRSRSEK